jgi:hypothetical protein
VRRGDDLGARFPLEACARDIDADDLMTTIAPVPKPPVVNACSGSSGSYAD